MLEAQIQTTPHLRTYADLFSIFFQLEEMQIPVSYDFYSEPETISGKTKLKSKIVINMENPQIATFISAWNAKQNEKDLLNKSVDKTNDTEFFKSNIEKDYQQWKERMLSLFNIPIN